MFFQVMEVVILISVFLFGIFQVIIPIFNGTKLFPAFRSRVRKLDQESREIKTSIELSKEEKQVKELKEQLKSPLATGYANNSGLTHAEGDNISLPNIPKPRTRKKRKPE